MNLKTALSKFSRIVSRAAVATVAIGAALWAAPSAHAFRVGIDLNTYKASYGTDTATFSKLKGDFMYAITVNSDLTIAQWTTAYNTLKGPDNWVVSEDNPPEGTYPQHPSYDTLLAACGHVNDAMSYYETGATPGGTILTPGMVTSEAWTHGGTITVLTRDYNTTWPAWRTNTDAAIANPKVTAVIMETANPYANQDCAQLVTACLNANKRVYFLLPATNTTYAVASLQYLINTLPAATMADSRVNIIVYNYSGGSWFGGTNTSQGTLNALLGMESTSSVKSGHTYRIFNANSGLVLDNPGASKVSGQPIDQYDVNFTDRQSWVATQVAGGWTFRNVASGLVLEAPGLLNAIRVQKAIIATGPTILPLDQSKPVGTQNQCWRLTYNDDGTFILRNGQSNLGMTVAWQSSSDSARVVESTEDGTVAMAWIFKDTAVY